MTFVATFFLLVRLGMAGIWAMSLSYLALGASVDTAYLLKNKPELPIP